MARVQTLTITNCIVTLTDLDTNKTYNLLLNTSPETFTFTDPLERIIESSGLPFDTGNAVTTGIEENFKVELTTKSLDSDLLNFLEDNSPKASILLGGSKRISLSIEGNLLEEETITVKYECLEGVIAKSPYQATIQSGTTAGAYSLAFSFAPQFVNIATRSRG